MLSYAELLEHLEEIRNITGRIFHKHQRSLNDQKKTMIASY